MKFVMKVTIIIILMCINPGAAYVKHSHQSFSISKVNLRLYSILVVGPRIIRRNQDYNVVISNILGESHNDCLLNVSIEQLGFPSRSVIAPMQTVKVMAYANKMVTFKIPSNITNGNYNIVIEGKQPSTSSNDNIFKEEQLFYIDSLENPVAFIQLNKPVVTPGESLKFRVIILKIDLKLVMAFKTSVSVYVFDPNHEVIRHWSNVSLYNGVYENQITIPTIPVLGTYKVGVMHNDIYMESKTFEVKNYNMYSIELNIYPTVVPFRRHQELNLTIDVKNNLGKPVRGNLTIFPVRTTFEEYLTTKTYTRDVHGIQQILIPFKHMLKIGRGVVILNITFTEHLTNRIISKEQDIKVYGPKYKVKLHNKTLKYFPGSSVITIMTVFYQNDEPAKNITLLVEVKGSNKLYRQKCTSNMNGQITFAMQTNKSMELYQLKVYQGIYQLLSVPILEVDSDKVLPDKHIKVELLTRVKFNRMLRLLVTCSDNMTILLYYVVSNGILVEFGFFKPDQSNRYPFKIMMSDELIPRAKITVFTVVRDTLIHGDVELSINEFGNPVKTDNIRLKKESHPFKLLIYSNFQIILQLEIKIEENIGEDGVDPGDEIELGIRGRPGAFVALTAYDQRLLQYSEDHDILFTDIWKMVDTPYDRQSLFPYRFINDLGIFVTDDTIKITGKCQRCSSKSNL
ncbi:CD109 antigen-like isoform X1 [Anopheles albimanus]|uniref:CD109 antigen-like isoform X1 n=1 Tax=Anopheles albimanus TaxID=7167 RepID=UPI001642341A|nr:CD109 antigen-like isoform X1 [Anopheles albimanus]